MFSQNFCGIFSQNVYGRPGDPAIRKRFYQIERSEICSFLGSPQRHLNAAFCADSSEIICRLNFNKHFENFMQEINFLQNFTVWSQFPQTVLTNPLIKT
jgi:hypothetical protein